MIEALNIEKEKLIFMTSQKCLRIIIPYLKMGGTERHLSQLLPALAQKGWKIKLFVLSEDLPLQGHFNHSRITLKGLSPLTAYSFLKPFHHFFEIIKLLTAEFKTDKKTLTHFFLPKAYILGLLLGKFWRVKSVFVMSRRSLNTYQKRHKILRLEPLLHPFCKAILVNSKAIQEELIQKENVPKERIHLIYNGLNLKNLTPTRSSKASHNSFNMIIVANLIFYKGHQDLFKALNLIKKELGDNWILTLVGQDRGQLTFLQKQAQDLGISSHLRWILNSDNPEPYLLKADLGLLPSHEEGFSNALLEMMAFGLPVIATNVGGNSEAILPEKTGLLVPPKNPQALAEAILRLFQNPRQRHSMGKEGFERFQALFTLPECVQHYEKVYETLLSQESP